MAFTTQQQQHPPQQIYRTQPRQQQAGARLASMDAAIAGEARAFAVDPLPSRAKVWSNGRRLLEH